VDAIFTAGSKRRSQLIESVVTDVNASGIRCAIDLPPGCRPTRRIDRAVVEAGLTVTLATPKRH
jgi:NAD(P)H-hydrate repair Nnr-like enzyme with NAD(P)H-hydrate epimerase domain